MTWLKIKFFVMDALLLAARYWYLVLAFFVFVGVGAYVDGCRRESRERKIDRIEANITEQETVANVLANTKANAAAEVNRSEQNSNAARRDLDDSRRSDSGIFAGVNAEDKYCRKFCLDSTCVEWRKRNPGFVCN